MRLRRRGTSIIPGTHRKSTGGKGIIPELEPWMVHTVEAWAGSVLFFTESLIHSATPVFTDIRRYTIITGYVEPFMREYVPTDAASVEFLKTVAEEERAFLTGDGLIEKGPYGFRLS